MNVLYLARELSVGGITKCIYNLCDGMKNETITIASCGGALQNNFTSSGITHYKIPNVEKKNVFLLIYTIFILRKIIRDKNISLIHSHHRMTTLLARVAILGKSTKIIHTQHLNIQDKFFLTRIALRRISVICVSKDAKNILISKCKLEGKYIEVVYNTIDRTTDIGEVDELIEEMKEKGHFIVAHISRLVSYKGVFEFVEIANEVLNVLPEARFFLIGDGPEYSRLKSKIEQLQINDKVFLLGPKKNILKQLEGVDLVLLCSEIEGLPLVPLEAFYKKIPVVATNIEGTREEITNGKNGFLIEQKDIQAFSQKIIYLYHHPEIYSKMKVNAFETFAKDFTFEKYLTNHIVLYNMILQGRELSDGT